MWVWRNHQKTIIVVKVSQAKPPLIASSPPPHLLAKRRVFRADFPRGEAKSAKKKRHGYSPWQVATLRGEGGVISELISFDNGSLVLRPIQHEGGQWCAAPFLFWQDLPNSYWWPTAALTSLYSGARLYKGPRTRLALSQLHCILQATSLCERRKSATATHVEQ